MNKATKVRIYELNAEYETLQLEQEQRMKRLGKINTLMQKLNKKRTSLWLERDRAEKDMRRIAGQIWQLVQDEEGGSVWDSRRKSQSPHL